MGVLLVHGRGSEQVERDELGRCLRSLQANEEDDLEQFPEIPLPFYFSFYSSPCSMLSYVFKLKAAAKWLNEVPKHFEKL